MFDNVLSLCVSGKSSHLRVDAHKTAPIQACRKTNRATKWYQNIMGSRKGELLTHGRALKGDGSAETRQTTHAMGRRRRDESCSLAPSSVVTSTATLEGQTPVHVREQTRQRQNLSMVPCRHRWPLRRSIRFAKRCVTATRCCSCLCGWGRPLAVAVTCSFGRSRSSSTNRGPAVDAQLGSVL